MSPIEWYYARDNKQMGPVSSVELKRLAAAGSIAPDDLVWREGMTEWAAARNVRGLFDEEGSAGQGGAAPASATPSQAAVPTVEPATKPVEPAPAATAMPVRHAPSRHLFDVMLEKFRPVFGPKFIETTAAVFRRCGSYGLFAAVALTAVFAVIAATKASPAEHLIHGAIWIIVLLALQYVAGKFCDVVERLNRETTGSLTSSTLPDCLAMLFKVAGASVLLMSVASAVATSDYSVILPGVAAFIVGVFLSIIAMNPGALNISIAPETLPGGEIIGVVLFLMKSLLRLVPVAFGVGVLCGTIALVYATASLAVVGGESLNDSLTIAGAACRALFFSAALPLAAYLLFLQVNLILNLWRSILSLPGKLDKLAESKQEEGKTQA